MSKKKVGAAAALLLALSVLAGCWDRRELNDLAIAVGIGMDKDGERVRVTAQIVNPGEVASKKGGVGYSTPVTIMSATEHTFFEALRKLTTAAPRRVFPSHLRVLVIGEELARHGIGKAMDGVSRNHEFRSDFFLIVAREAKADQVLKILTPIEKIPANKMFNTLEMSEKVWAPTVKMPLDAFISDLSDKTNDTVLTGLRIVGDQDAGKTKWNVGVTGDYTKLEYSGLALFKGDKLVDWLSDEESKGYNYVMGNVKNTVGHLSCPQGGDIALEVVRASSRIKGFVVEGRPRIEIELLAEENVGEVQCEIDPSDPETIGQLEDMAEQKLKQIVLDSIRKAQKHEADIFRFGEAIEDAEPRGWLKLEPDWPARFAEMDVEVRVDVQIRRLGTTNSPIKAGEE